MSRTCLMIEGQEDVSWADWLRLAHVAEEHGFDALFTSDHYASCFGVESREAMDAWAVICGLAAVTSTIRLGTMVSPVTFRPPAVLAKLVAAADAISGGRVELGLGAGWMATDYEQSGIPYDRPGVRVDRMVEGIAVMKGMFADGQFSFAGEHYTITNHDALPKPVTRPHPPILIGGGGKRVLGIAAREADIVGINPNLRAGEVGPDAASDATAAATDRKVEWVREAAGDRFDDLELNALVLACIESDDRQGTAEMMAGVFGITPDEMLEVPHALMGTIDEMAADLEARRERWGFSYHVVQQDAMETLAPVVARLAGT